MDTTRFWDLARQAKSVMDDNLRSVRAAAVNVIVDQEIHAKVSPSLTNTVKIRYSQTSDANISNIGRYPYAKKYSLADEKSSIIVKSLHVYNPVPHLASSAAFFVSSVDAFCYSMGHKCEDNAAKLLFNTWVELCENIGSIGTEETLAEVLERLEL